MTDPLYITAGELQTDEILGAIEEGRRVVVTTKLMDEEVQITLRHDGSTYYCDTPVRLHRHENQQEMRQCIRRMGYASDSGPDPGELDD